MNLGIALTMTTGLVPAVFFVPSFFESAGFIMEDE